MGRWNDGSSRRSKKVLKLFIDFTCKWAAFALFYSIFWCSFAFSSLRKIPTKHNKFAHLEDVRLHICAPLENSQFSRPTLRTNRLIALQFCTLIAIHLFLFLRRKPLGDTTHTKLRFRNEQAKKCACPTSLWKRSTDFVPSFFSFVVVVVIVFYPPILCA